MISAETAVTATSAERIAAWSGALQLEKVPAAVVEDAKLRVLDTLGCGLAAHGLGVGGEGRASVADLGGHPEATVIGLATRLPAVDAALANAMLCHGLDFDDTHSDAVSHSSVVVAPVALAAGEAASVSGKLALTAFVAGSEIFCRVAMAGSGRFHERGFHPTEVCGIFGGTVAAAKLAGLDAEATTRALGIAGSMAGGLLAYLGDGTPTKPMHPAWAAHGSQIAVALARNGASGPSSVFDARFGLYHAFLSMAPGTSGLERQLDDLGWRWETPRSAYKPYPACHLMHGSLGAAAQVAAGRTFAPEEIDHIVVTVPAAWVSVILEPAAYKLKPRSPYEAKFSLQYSVASLLTRGHLSVGDFTDEAIADPAVLAVAAKVAYETPDFPTHPRAFPGGIRIRLASGKTLAADLPYQQGHPQNPLSAHDIRAKFRANAALCLSQRAVAALERTILNLEHQRELSAALAPLTLTKEADR